MRYGLSSLDGRFIWVTATILLLLVIITVYSNILVNRSIRDGLVSIENNARISQDFVQLKEHLQNIQINLFQYSSFLDDAIEKETYAHIVDIKLILSRLGTYTNNILASDHKHELSTIRTEVSSLEKLCKTYFTIMRNVETRYPGMPYLLQHLAPNNQKFSQAVELAIQESEITDAQIKRLNRQQYEVLKLFQEIRYSWAQKISWLRLAVSNRMGAFGDPEDSMHNNLANRLEFKKQVAEKLLKLNKFDKKGVLGLQQQESLVAMHEASREYEKNFDEAIAIYLSPNWRADIPLMTGSIFPVLNEINNNIKPIEASLNATTLNNIETSHATSRLLSVYIWVFSGGLILILSLGYYVFHVSIRRPVLEIAQAMQAEARGEHYVPRIDEQLLEVKLLRHAFFGMQDQVHSRQQRLEAILNNAAEGILTFDERGIIESCNRATERLFEYSQEALVGVNIINLMPEVNANEFTNFIQLLLSQQNDSSYRDIEVLAKRKGGSHFSMSIKVSNMEIRNKSLYIALVEDISERKAFLENLKHLAEHDSLTTLYNRQFFTEELERAIAKAQRDEDFRSACIYMDLDNFKYVNDTLGHLAGDRLLIAIANILKQRTRKSDLLARLGGDEFAMYFYNVTEEQIMSIVEEYRDAISSYKFIQDGMTYTVACSIGIAMMNQDVTDKEELLARADIACHAAKRNGRNCAHLYDVVDRERIDNIHTDMGWSQKIKDAISGDHFVFATQSVHEIATGDTHAYEVLLRMKEDENNLIMPSGFLSSAERFGLIPEIDSWVIRNACQLLAELKPDAPDTQFSINLSAKSIGKQEILLTIQNAIEQNSLKPHDIIFEITEDVAISDFPNAIAFLNELRKLGCKTALDDFGAGYSSFSYLKELPVDYVKIDGSFILNIEHDNLNQALVKAMNDVCHTLNKKTIAEFVENENALKILEDIGVDYAQGFVIERPRLRTAAKES